MSWKNAVFSNFKLYAVTDIKNENEDIFEKIKSVYRGGADIVQLRSKTLCDGALYRMGLKIREIADRNRKLFFVNDRADLALALNADGIHLGQDDLSVKTVRRLCVKAGKPLWIGKSTHSLKQGLEALRENPDYIGVGPVFETPTKPDYPAAGLKYIKQAAAKIHIPFVAIGGIDAKNLPRVLEAGARRIAVVRALFDVRDPMKAAQNLKKIMEGKIDA